MKLEEKAVALTGTALLAGLTLCLYFIAHPSAPPKDKVVLLKCGTFLAQGDLRTDITHEIMKRKIDVREVKGGPGVRNHSPVLKIYGAPPSSLLPGFEQKPNCDLIDFQYQPSIDPKTWY